MKRKVITILLATAITAGGAFAQTMSDAYQFSEYNYEGTARTIAMGNAFTALGGDLGSITINPAGSAVARYSQFTVTPSLNISVNKAVGLPFDGKPNGFENQYRNTKVSGGMPNIGVTLNFDTHRTTGIKNWSIGFVSNVTNTFMDNAYTTGTNHYTSFMGAMAADADYYLGDNYDDRMAVLKDLYSSDAWDRHDWRMILGAQSGIFDNIYDKDTDTYTDVIVGASEGYVLNDETGKYDISLNGPINQKYSRKISGSKHDHVFNISFNISDIVFIGANLGMSSMDYRYEDVMVEKVDPSVTAPYFTDMKYTYNLKTSGFGVYGKFGIIVTPGAGFRFGAAIQTPTSVLLKDTFYMTGATNFVSEANAKAETPESKFEYRLSSPLRFNVGAAKTFGKFGVLSVDYEICNYNSMRFHNADSIDDEEFSGTNNDIREFMGKSHMLRAGLEIKPFKSFAVRAGYGFTTNPEKEYVDEMQEDTEYIKNTIHKFSFGLGFDSGGSFFADLACSARTKKDYIIPYGDYLDILSPTIENKRMLWNAVITLGFRF